MTFGTTLAKYGASALPVCDNWGYKHTHRLRITYGFSTVKMVMRTSLNVVLCCTLPLSFKIKRRQAISFHRKHEHVVMVRLRWYTFHESPHVTARSTYISYTFINPFYCTSKGRTKLGKERQSKKSYIKYDHNDFAVRVSSQFFWAAKWNKPTL